MGKSWNRLQVHMVKEHGEQNKHAKALGLYNKKEALSAAEEQLKRDISKYNFYNTDRKKH